jgi:pimeloyl-ACP methyl ester carboxylesterase
MHVRESGRHMIYGAGLHAWCWGEAGPLVVLVHGWGGASVQWSRFIARLTEAGLRVVARFRETLAQQLRSDWDGITARAFRPSDGGELLLIHDPRDRYLDHDDVPRILAHWPGAQLHLAAGVGHEHLIRDDECVTALLEFLRD